jgi:alkylation response protein AidB-like acyl-CoA dehydrogenase
MLDYRLDAETEALRKTVREFAMEVVAPQIGEFYERDEFPTAIVRQMGELGLFGLPFSEEYGGSGGDYFTLCVALEELARVDSSIAITLEAGVSLGAMPIYRFGTEEQKQRWLPRLCAGEALGAFGLTEPGGGSDAGATRTTAKLEDGQWVINGSKAFITNSGTELTELVTVTAVTGTRPDGGKEISAILVPSGTPGFTVGQRYSKVGWNASDTRELSFSDCRVPEENLVGEQGRGYAQFLSILDEGRIAIKNQAIQFMIADMEVRAETARLAYYRAAEKMLRGEPFKREAAVAKLYSSEMAMENARWATQVHGGYGFMNEFPVGRFYRDAKILEIGEGTSEVQRMLIARSLGVG